MGSKLLPNQRLPRALCGGFPKTSRDGWKAFLPYELRALIWAEGGLRPANLTEGMWKNYIAELEVRRRKLMKEKSEGTYNYVLLGGHPRTPKDPSPSAAGIHDP